MSNGKKGEIKKIRIDKGNRLPFPLSPLFPYISFFAPLILYVATLAPSVLNDDPGEYQTILPVLGVAHPTGYPLYTLLGHLFTRVVPFGDMAYRVNLFSALAAAAAIAVLFTLLRALDVSSLVALLAALALSVSSDFWTYATIAQTYALNLLLMTLALFFFVRWQQHRDRTSLIALAFVCGLGVAHHSMFWLLVPALFLFLIIDLRSLIAQSPINNLQSSLFIAFIVFVLPLALYLYIPLRGELLRAAIPEDILGYPRVVTDGWLTPHYLPGWTNVVVGSFYASSTLQGASLDWLSALGDYLARLFAQFNLFALLSVFFIVPVFQRQRRVVALLILAWLVNFVVVVRGVAAFNEPAGGLFTPTYLFAIILIALVVAEVARRFSLVLAVMLLAALCVANLALNVGAHVGAQPSRDRAAAARVLNGTVPDAVVLGAWTQITPLHYLQIVEGVRRDVAVIHAPLTDEVVRDFAARVSRAQRPLYLLRPPDQLTRVLPP